MGLWGVVLDSDFCRKPYGMVGFLRCRIVSIGGPLWVNRTKSPNMCANCAKISDMCAKVSCESSDVRAGKCLRFMGN
jgi:hypothetical protein